MADKVWAGAKLWIGGSGVTPTWVEVGEVIGFTGDLGATWKTADASVLADVYDRTAKTTRDPGKLDVTYRVGSNAGQTAVAAANDDAVNSYHFKVSLADDAPSAGDNPTTFVFKALVLSANKVKGANRNGLIEATASLDIQGAVTYTAAAA